MWTLLRVTVMLCAVTALSAAGSLGQADRFTGRWVAPIADNGIFVAVDIGESNTFTLPGMHRDGTADALRLPITNLAIAGDRATFSVELPDEEGMLSLEMRVAAADDSAEVRVTRGPDLSGDDLPKWSLRRVR